MVGDNKNAYSDPEVVSPLSKLQGMIDSGNGENTEILQQILMYLKMFYDHCKDVDNNSDEMTITLDSDILFQKMVKKNRAYKRRHGGKGVFD